MPSTIPQIEHQFERSPRPIGVFVFCYRYERSDDLLANATGAAAIGVALFPTRPEGPVSTAQVVVGWLHLTSAAVFFALLAWIWFVKGDTVLRDRPAVA